MGGEDSAEGDDAAASITEQAHAEFARETAFHNIMGTQRTLRVIMQVLFWIVLICCHVVSDNFEYESYCFGMLRSVAGLCLDRSRSHSVKCCRGRPADRIIIIIFHVTQVMASYY